MPVASPCPAPDVVAAEIVFADLSLPPSVLEAITELGFVRPTPIQAQAIPPLLRGRDITGVAQTGTGKTAAFGLSLLARIDTDARGVQALVLTPTRELAIQVADALAAFAARLPRLRVVPVYGGAPFHPQQRALAAGAQIVVGTPGRIIDHLERKTLDLSGVRFLVLDEADEMLKMGFAEDVDRILTDAPADRQTALFSATMPPAIRKVAATHLTDPVDIRIESRTSTTSTVRQRYAVLPYRQKVGALARAIKIADGATLVFVRTKSACDEVATGLTQQGIPAAALNGDVPQTERERIVDRLRAGTIDVVVATDVAARGLDVERIGQVVNFDVPQDTETYVHRIGRTARAGRAGEALTFFTPREVGQVRTIERSTGAKLERITPPSHADVAAHRIATVSRAATERIDGPRMDLYRAAVADLVSDGLDPLEIAAALLATAAGDDGSAIPEEAPVRPPSARDPLDRTSRSERPRGDRPRLDTEGGRRSTRTPGRRGPATDRPGAGHARLGTPARWRVAVGHQHGVQPGGIVGAITGEGGLAGRDLGRIEIFDSYSTVEIAPQLAPAVLRRLGLATLMGQRLRIRKEG